MYPIAKRCLDVLVSAVALLVFSPLLIVIGVLIKLDSRGPVFYWGLRVGRERRCFSMVKFRSMKVGTDKVTGDLLLGLDNPAVTALGRFLRRWRIDELPQLWNVLRGDMSLVGPRPALLGYMDKYRAEELERFSVLPGVTGWVQVNGANDLKWSERVSLEVDYVHRRGFWLDLKILAMTLPAVVRGEKRFETRNIFAHPDDSRAKQNDRSADHHPGRAMSAGRKNL
ncbi:MAG: sugar transferase [Candidatus Binatia bacterium]